MFMITFTRKYDSGMLRTILVDDEERVRKTLEIMLRKHCPNVKIVAEADGVESGIQAIKKHHPDLVLLDIKMDDGTGFDLLWKLDPVDFKVIFITAYDQYAIKAIKFSALDYLLKPVDPDELVHAVAKAEKMVLDEMNKQLDTLAENVRGEEKSSKKIILKTFDNIHLLRIRDISYCESNGNYTNFHLLNGKVILVSVTLKEYDDMLSEYGFFRAHKSFLVNLAHVERFEKSEGGSIVLADEVKIPVSYRKKEQLIEMLHRITEH
jgi:two-component system, LytTR family, response regulator